ncbi:MAG: hypothetical protein J3T61_03220 [Candidatus Brocadiales bacterium]|nr:hypothetical protein [Candidatus Bathyanammoxibius sp.]
MMLKSLTLILIAGISGYWLFLESGNAGLNQALCEGAIERRLAVEADMTGEFKINTTFKHPLSGFNMLPDKFFATYRQEAERLQSMLVAATKDVNTYCKGDMVIKPVGSFKSTPTTLKELLKLPEQP